MLTDKLDAWELLKRELDALEADIKEEVLSLRTSVAHGAVQVKFTKGATKYDYQGMSSATVIDPESGELLADAISAASTTAINTTVKWKSVSEALGIPTNVRDTFKTIGSPKVAINLVAV